MRLDGVGTRNERLPAGYIGIEISLRNEIFFHDAYGVVWLLEPTQDREMPLRIVKIAVPMP